MDRSASSGPPEVAVELSIVMPAFNEATTVGHVVRAHDQIARSLGIPYEILVMDDGSSDSTRSVLEEVRPTVPALRIHEHPRNLGIGRSLLDLYRLARGSWIYFNAADGQIPAGELLKLWDIRNGNALVVGDRRPRRDPVHRVAFAAVYSGLMHALFGVPIGDVHSVKLYRADALRRCWPRTESSFAEDEILISLHRSGARMAEVRIAHRPRAAGRAYGGTWRIASRAFADLVRYAIEDKRR